MKYVSPGVYVREIDLSLYIPTLSSTIAAMVITATKGPINEKVFVSNPNAFIAKFGQPSPDHLGSYAAMQFLRRGSQLWVVRVSGTDAAAATASIRAVKLPYLVSGKAVASNTQVFSVTSSAKNVAIVLKDGRSGTVATLPTQTFTLTLPQSPATTLTVKQVAEDLANQMRRNATTSNLITAVSHTVGGTEKLYLVGLQPSTQVSFSVTAADTNDALTVLGFVGDADTDQTASLLASDQVFTLTARSDGTWANALTVQTTVNPITPFTFDLGIYQSSEQFSSIGSFKGLRTELFQTMSLDDSVANWIGGRVGTVNTASLVPVFSDVANAGASASVAYNITADDTMLSTNAGYMRFVLPQVGAVTLTGGDDGLDSIIDADYIGITLGTAKTGLQLFRNPEEIDINLLMCPGQSSPAIINELLAICEERGDAMTIIDSPDGYSVQQVVDWHNGSGAFADHQSFSSSYGALYYSWIQIYDAYNNVNVWTAPSGHVSAVYAYTDFIAETWFAPAGFNRAHIVAGLQVRYSPDLGEREFMYGNGNAVNPIVQFPQDGITVWGQRTLQRAPTALDRVNVRRLLLYMRKVVARATKYFVFEPDDKATWRAFVRLVSPFCDTIKTRRGLYDFAVICDETTNPPDQLDNNIMNARIYIKPTKAAEVINVDMVITSTGATFSEILF